jgi:hypothetical protein
LGQTVLTFKNRAETSANITATLSAEALAEVRRRAGIEDRAETLPRKRGGAAAPVVVPVGADVTPVPLAAVENVAPAQASPEAIAEAEKKKKKKKKATDDRLKAAYIGGISRILAQIFAVVLSVGLALYITQRNMNPEKPVIDTSSKGKAKVKVPVSSAGTLFNAGKDAAGADIVVEASGATQVLETDGVLLVDDSKPNEVLWMQLDPSGQQVGQVKFINSGADIADPEGIASDGSFFYIVGSQSHAEAGQRNALARFTFDASSQAIQGQVEVMNNLRDFLLQNIPELKDVSEKPGNAGGLNVEGVAWDPVNGRLLLGLRSPVVNGKALVVPIKLREPRGSFTTDNLLPPGPAIQLSLNGLGIRDIQYDRRTKSFLIIAGAHSTGGNTESWLWEWNGDADQSNAASLPQQIIQLDAAMKPEGAANVKIGGRDYIFIAGDGGRYLKLDYVEGP